MAKEEEEVTEKSEELQRDLVISQQGGAVYANKFTCTVSGVVRLAFLEDHPGIKSPQFRTAVAMHHQDAIELYKLLQNLLQDFEKDLEEMKKLREKTGD